MNRATPWIAVWAWIVTGQALAQAPLSPVSLFNRCYAQLTSDHPSQSSPLVAAVRAGTTDPIAACIGLLNQAKFTAASSGRLTDGTATSKAVLKTFHNLHFSWFRVREWPTVLSGITQQGAADIMDVTMPAMFLTRALLMPGATVDGIFRGTDVLRAVRTNMDPASGPATLTPKSSYSELTGMKFAPTGELLGIERWTDGNLINFVGGHQGPGFQSLSGQVDFAKSLGGGILGSSGYTVQNVRENPEFQANGVSMPRKWARSVFSDFLCRELPVVRRADAAAFVDPASSVAYRNSVPCTQCHVSMDRTAAVMRNFRHMWPGTGAGDPVRAPEFYSTHAVNAALTNIDVFPTAPIANYHMAPPKGVLYFRNYTGALVNTTVDNVDGLANAIAAQDDAYICLAKRYYQYFTGIDVQITDPADPDRPTVRSTAEKAHFDRVVDLGLSLKGHGSLAKLIEDILRSEPYRWSDFQSLKQGE